MAAEALIGVYSLRTGRRAGLPLAAAGPDGAGGG